ncbi:MAG: hypothetical protein QG663_1385 [Thermodesulfobacteriota bacterium]|nr:hypothetical protein [Thermodesulfobacteriota bacterium]
MGDVEMDSCAFPKSQRADFDACVPMNLNHKFSPERSVY